MVEQDIAARLEGHITAMRVELNRCESALAVLRGSATVAATNGASPKRAQTKPPRRRTTGRATVRPRDTAKATDAQVLEALEGTAQAQGVANKLNASYRTVLNRLHDMEARGMVAREGQRHNTRWTALTPAA